MGIWKDAHTFLTNWQMSLQLGTSINSGHQLSVSICSDCHVTPGGGVVKRGFRKRFPLTRSSSCFSPNQDGPSPLRNSATCGSSMGGPPKSSTLGCDQSEGSAVVALGDQDNGGDSSASALSHPWKLTEVLLSLS